MFTVGNFFHRSAVYYLYHTLFPPLFTSYLFNTIEFDTEMNIYAMMSPEHGKNPTLLKK